MDHCPLFLKVISPFLVLPLPLLLTSYVSCLLPKCLHLPEPGPRSPARPILYRVPGHTPTPRILVPSGTLLPQDFCTCCQLYPEHCYHRSTHGACLYFIYISALSLCGSEPCPALLQKITFPRFLCTLASPWAHPMGGTRGRLEEG